MSDKQGDERFNTAVEAIYAAALAPPTWPDALTAIAGVFGDLGALLIYQRDDGSFGTIVSPSLDAAQVDYQREWWPLDIRMSRAIEFGYGSGADAVTDRDVASEAELDDHPFYRDFLLPRGMGWFAGTQVSPDPRIAAALSIQRARAKPPFSREELTLVARLGRHVETALRLGVRLINAEVASLTLGDALARLGVGVFLLDGLGRIVFANSAGEAMLGEGLTRGGDRLVAVHGAENEALEVAIAAVSPGRADGPPTSPRPVLVHNRDGLAELAAYVLPARLQSYHPVEQLFADARAVVVIVPATGREPDPALLRDLLGLTLGEARVAALVGTGTGPREAGQRLGITEETARSVLKRVFAKTGVSRQSELAALLARFVLH